jgi:alkanesulfonate monooxygenase SsuD/methylene tetrahydromethanopterin reductase-like flavin-dependent oxidoreductase (luciferase family)
LSIEVGVGIWNMRSTSRRPGVFTELYAQAISDAQYAEALGIDSIWFAEHRFWYDGWCPQPLLVAAAVAASTARIKVGTGIHLLPQHDPVRAAIRASTLDRFFPGRLALGVALGYRAEEYDGLGLDIGDRVKLLRRGLDALEEHSFRGPVLVGGMAEVSIRRAAKRGLSLLLPPGLSPGKVGTLVALAREEAAAAGTTIPRVGLVKDVWADRDGDAARSFSAASFGSHYSEYAQAWWALDPITGVPNPAKVAAQVERSISTVVTGSPDEVFEQLAAYTDVGVDLFMLQIHIEETAARCREQLGLLAETVIPRLRQRGSG